MNYMDQSIIHECTAGSFAGKLTFPQCLQKLVEIGVESYIVDLSNIPSIKIVYGKNKDSYKEICPLFDAPAIAATFDATQVKKALLAVQHKEIDYPEFLRRIMKAGVSRYEVYINQYKTIYFGQERDSYTEIFPASFLNK